MIASHYLKYKEPWSFKVAERLVLMKAGALKILCKHITDEDRENGEEGRLLFDVVAGTSIGAMNGTILVSQFLENQSGKKQ